MFKKAKDFKKRLVEYYKEEENKKVAIFYTFKISSYPLFNKRNIYGKLS